MAAIKISSKVDEATWNEFKLVANESHQSISGLLAEAIRDSIRRRRLRPEVLEHLELSIEANRELGRRLAR